MTLQQLYYCIVTADTGSMNQAAEKLFISQPTLTSAIKELEKETGITIFHRSSRGVSLTSEGKEFLMYARQIYLQYELMKEKYDPKGDTKKKFAVSCQHYSFATKAFVETVKAYDTLLYDFALRETKTLDVLQDVGTSKSEIGVIFLSEFNRKYITKLLDEKDLSFTPLKECDAFVYLYKHHPLAKQSSIGMNELEDYPYITFDQGETGAFYLAEEILAENDYNRKIMVNDRATALNLLIGLNGYMLCSGIICEELNGEDCIVVPYRASADNPNCVMEIGFIHKRHALLSKVAQTYIEQLQAYFM